MSLRRTLHSSVAAICIAAVAAPAGLAAPPAAQAAPASNPARGPLDVRVAQAADFSRIEFRWTTGTRATARRDGDDLILRFSRDAHPDISRLKVDPPRWVKAAQTRHVNGVLEFVLTLTADGDAKTGTADGATFINVFQKAPAAPGAPPQTQAEVEVTPEPARPNPVPASGVVMMEPTIKGGQLLLSFTWANPNGAAVFRRGDALWMVFDAPARIDVSKAPRGLRQFNGIRAFQGTDYSALRISSPPGTPVFATSLGSIWTLALGPGPQAQPSLIQVTRDAPGGPAALTVPVAGVTRVVKVADPVVGDTITAVTALGPSKGLPSRREFVQMALLPTAQGLAVESYIDDLDVTRDGDLVHVGRTAGLALSPASASMTRVESTAGAPQPARFPAMIDYQNWPKTGSGGFLARYNALLDAASEEAAQGKDGPVAARMALARFLVGSELSFEAIGVLNDTARASPKIMDDPEFRGLRGLARVMARRYKEAAADFSSPILGDDPSSALWRSYIAAQGAQWTEARQQFAAGAEAFNQFSPVWKARFARADAQAALNLGDLASAEASIKLALMDRTPPLEELETRLVQARLVEAQGYTDRALRIYQAVSRAPAEYLSAPAILHATQIKFAAGKLTPLQAVNIYDGLRYRWRGDSTELETIRALGHLYLSQGRYREALEALRSAGQRMSDLPEAMQLQADLAAAFRSLFLEGLADGLEPVQALALFYDFKDLTPLGADGDLMVRKLVRRLVDVDLLDQAATFLQYQADNRLDGLPRAQVATDLAVIYLMDRQPEKALQAINASRTTILPGPLNAERRLVEARALLGLGRYDHALEVLARETGKDAQDLRSEITWKSKDWSAAGALFEKGLGDRWKQPGPLSADEESRLMRAGIAFSLAGDDASLTRLQQRYASFYEKAGNPEALRVALNGMDGGQLSVSDFGRTTADNEAFAGWVAKMKQRFRDKAAAPVKTAAPVKPAPAPAAKTAQAASPAKG